MKIADGIFYVGVNDRKIDLFEGQYVVPEGMAYNSYVIIDDAVAVMDTVDAKFTHEWLDNVQKVLGRRKPDYLVVQHMEPDHSANINNFAKLYPEVKIVASKKAFTMMKNFFGTDIRRQKDHSRRRRRAHARKTQRLNSLPRRWFIGRKLS